uniref:DNA primase n=1 Tax=viral metagenome TaxID=1070528 RepID=A0A6M3M0D6_9ZZZZ
MYQISMPLTMENILKRVSEWDIFVNYCPELTEPDTPFRSVFREDLNPSCRVSLLYGRMIYKDFGEIKSFNCFGYVSRRFNLSFVDALQKINRDFNLGLEDSGKEDIVYTNVTIGSMPKLQERSQTIIKVKTRSWSDIDQVYWYDNFHISKDVVYKSYTFPISHFWINNHRTDNQDLLFTIETAEPAYGYYFGRHEGIDLWYIYRPTKNKYRGRWKSNVRLKVIDGWRTLPESGNIVFIQKSRKDRLLMNVLGYNCVNGINESSLILREDVDRLKNMFDNVVIYYDNDEPGIERAQTFSEQFSIPYIHNPINEPKDVTDFQMTYKDTSKTTKLVNSLVNKVI